MQHLQWFIEWSDKHSGLAAWVQAFGSIAAILASAWLAGRTMRDARWLSLRGELVHVENAKRIADLMRHQLRQALRHKGPAKYMLTSGELGGLAAKGQHPLNKASKWPESDLRDVYWSADLTYQIAAAAVRERHEEGAALDEETTRKVQDALKTVDMFRRIARAMLRHYGAR